MFSIVFRIIFTAVLIWFAFYVFSIDLKDIQRKAKSIMDGSWNTQQQKSNKYIFEIIPEPPIQKEIRPKNIVCEYYPDLPRCKEVKNEVETKFGHK